MKFDYAARKMTYFLDVDGCITEQVATMHSAQLRGPLRLLPGVIAKLDELEAAGHCIVLCSARKECCRTEFEHTLRLAGVFWDQLIMGLPNGARVLVNDVKEGRVDSAYAVNVKRNTSIDTVPASLEGLK